MELLTERYNNKIDRVLSCYDRLILSGTIPEISYSQGMTKYMYQNGVRIFDYPKFAEPFKEAIRANAERIAKEYGIEIEFIRKLDEFTWQFCPVYKKFNLRYHWSVMQAEYATDIVLKKQESLQQIYNELVATAIHTVKPENIATFLGQKLDSRYQGEVGNGSGILLLNFMPKNTQILKIRY